MPVFVRMRLCTIQLRISTTFVLTSLLILRFAVTLNKSKCCRTDYGALEDGLVGKCHFIGCFVPCSSFHTNVYFRKSKCYDLMKQMFCRIHCSRNQSQFVTPMKADSKNALVEFNVNITETFTEELFDACKVSVAPTRYNF